MHPFAYLIAHAHPFLWQFGTWDGTPIGIRFYGLAYLLGFIVLYFGLYWQARRGWSPLRGDRIADYVCWVAFLGVIVGGRLGSCLLYAPRETFEHPLSVLAYWHGGMASHGGVLGVILVMVWFGRREKIPFYQLADATALFTPVSLGLGRCANFLNGELWGRPGTVPWAMIFPQAPLVHGVAVPRHPSQIYEALLEGLVLQIILLTVRFSTRREGAVALSFMAGYAILRIIGEAFREPDIEIGYWFQNVTQGQLLSAIMLAVTLGLAARQFLWRKSVPLESFPPPSPQSPIELGVRK